MVLQKITIIAAIVVLSFFSSCVSKKKYLEMEAGRLTAERLSQQLDEENQAKAARIEALIADFEEMKNELLESNAIKDQYIDSLNGEVFTLTESLNKQKESLQETSFTLDFEQQRGQCASRACRPLLFLDAGFADYGKMKVGETICETRK